MWHFSYFIFIVLLVGLGCWDEMFANLDTLFDPVTSICLCQILLVLNLTLGFLLWWCCLWGCIMSIPVTALIKNSLHIGVHYIGFNVGPIAHLMMETTIHLPWIDMNFRLCWLSLLLFCHKLIPPLAQPTHCWIWCRAGWFFIWIWTLGLLTEKLFDHHKFIFTHVPKCWGMDGN